MEIKLVGTGAISAKERSACALIDQKILVDCGNGTIKTMLEQGININKIEAVLVTHLHGDHFLDLPFLIMQRNFDAADSKLNIYCPVGTTEAIAKIIEITYSEIPDWTVLRDKTKTKFVEFASLNSQEVAPGYFADSYLVAHGNFAPAYGFIIKHDDRAVGFSGDSTYCKAVDEIAKNSNLAILDASFVDVNSKHMSVHDIETLAQKYTTTIIPTHMSAPARTYMENSHLANIIVPKDGQAVNI